MCTHMLRTLISSSCRKQYVPVSLGPLPSGSLGVFPSIRCIQQDRLPTTSFSWGRVRRWASVRQGPTPALIPQSHSDPALRPLCSSQPFQSLSFLGSQAVRRIKSAQTQRSWLGVPCSSHPGLLPSAIEFAHNSVCKVHVSGTFLSPYSS